jgi:5-methylcytosine-specific restriction endonuclease McrA
VEETITCLDCHIEKPVTDFYFDVRKKHGNRIDYRKVCKDCTRDRCRAKRAADGEAGKAIRAAKAAAYHQRIIDNLHETALPSDAVVTCRRCLLTKFVHEMGKTTAHKTGIRALCKSCLLQLNKPKTPESAARRSTNRNISSRAYYLLNKDRIIKARKPPRRDALRASAANTRARRLGVPGRFYAKDIDDSYIEQMGLCVYCQCNLRHGYHVDHIIPITRLGTSNYPSNLQLLCPPCNHSKSNKTHEEYVNYMETIVPASEAYLATKLNGVCYE